MTSSIDVGTIYEKTASEVDRVIGGRDHAGALHLYNNKGLPGLVKRLASRQEGHPVLSALRRQLPRINS